MISEPNGASDESFHRRRKSGSSMSGDSQQDQSDLQQDQNESEEENSKNNNEPNKLSNILKYGLNVGSEGTFISQSEYYKDNKNQSNKLKNTDNENDNSEDDNQNEETNDEDDNDDIDMNDESEEDEKETNSENDNEDIESKDEDEDEKEASSENDNESIESEDEKGASSENDNEDIESKNEDEKEASSENDNEEIESKDEDEKEASSENDNEAIESKDENEKEASSENDNEDIESKNEDEDEKEASSENDNEAIESKDEKGTNSEKEENEGDVIDDASKGISKEGTKSNDESIAKDEEDHSIQSQENDKNEPKGDEKDTSLPYNPISSNQLHKQLTITNNVLVDKTPETTNIEKQSTVKPKESNQTDATKSSEKNPSKLKFTILDYQSNIFKTEQQPDQTNKISPEEEQKNIEDEHDKLITDIATEAINDSIYTRITPSNFNEVISRVRRIQRDALNDGDYELADRAQKSTSHIVRHVNNARFLAINEAKADEMNEQLQATQRDLQYLKDHWRTVLQNAKDRMNEDLQKLQAENDKELKKFDASVEKSIKGITVENADDSVFLDKKVMPVEYRKFSPELLEMRNREKALINARRYKEAKRVKDEADKLEQVELERNYERYLNKMQSKRNELLKKHENKVFVRKQNWEKSIEEIKRVSASEISHAEKGVMQLEKKIESAEELNMTIRSPRNGKMKSRNDPQKNESANRTSAVVRLPNKANLTPRVIRNKKNKRERQALQYRQRTLINRVTYSNLIVQPKVKKPVSPRTPRSPRL